MAKRIVLLVACVAMVAGVWIVWRSRAVPGALTGAATSGTATAIPNGAARATAAGAPDTAPAAATAGALPPVSPPPGPDLSAAMAAVARRVGKDPAAILARVRRVRYEVYPGVFRGAGLTISDNAGNDYDRAVLEHDLLTASNPGLPVRYAFCTLSPEQSAKAVAIARASYIAPHIGTAETMSATAHSPKQQRFLSRVATFWTAAIAQAQQQTEELTADFHTAGAVLMSPDPNSLSAIAADHVWVQYQNQGSWIDLDPSAAQASPGASICAAATTSDALPNDDFDALAATLRLESRDGGQEHDATIASGAWRTADLALTSVTFAFAETSELGAPAPQPDGMRAYTPVLVAGHQTIAAAPIVVPAPSRAGLKTAAGAMSKITDAFGDKPPVQPAPATPAGPIPVALRLDVAVWAPHAAPVTVERPIFDRISVADRAAGRAATAPLAPSSQAPFGTLWSVGVNLGSGVIGGGDFRLASKSDDPGRLIGDLAAMHRGYYMTRRAVFADVAGSPTPIATPRPGVTFIGLAPLPAGPKSFGLVEDRASEGAMPDGGGPNASLAWAVSSLYGERLTIGGPAMMLSGRPLDQLPFDDAIEMFYIARRSGNPPVLVRTATEVTRLSTSENAKARLMASLAGGASAVVPSAQVSYGGSNDHGWWILAPGGSVFDEMQSGMHQAPVEDAVDLKEDEEEAVHARRHGFLVKCTALLAAGIFGIAAQNASPEEALEFVEQGTEILHGLQEAKEREEMYELAEGCAEQGTVPAP